VRDIRLKEHQLEVYGQWQELRTDIELELMRIENALRNDPTQIGTSGEAIHESADRLRRDLVPGLTQIAKALDDQDWRETTERSPR
jgi:hypothetical protein